MEGLAKASRPRPPPRLVVITTDRGRSRGHALASGEAGTLEEATASTPRVVVLTTACGVGREVKLGSTIPLARFYNKNMNLNNELRLLQGSIDMTTSRTKTRRTEEDNMDQGVPPQAPPQALNSPLEEKITNENFRKLKKKKKKEKRKQAMSSQVSVVSSLVGFVIKGEFDIVGCYAMKGEIEGLDAIF
uniref:Gag-pol polyprotein n=1 Tax=Solanum tuberosum TaxID=4113 RepID=M1DQJ5_SOLTU